MASYCKKYLCLPLVSHQFCSQWWKHTNPKRHVVPQFLFVEIFYRHVGHPRTTLFSAIMQNMDIEVPQKYCQRRTPRHEAVHDVLKEVGLWYTLSRFCLTKSLIWGSSWSWSATQLTLKSFVQLHRSRGNCGHRHGYDCNNAAITEDALCIKVQWGNDHESYLGVGGTLLVVSLSSMIFWTTA